MVVERVMGGGEGGLWVVVERLCVVAEGVIGGGGAGYGWW